MLLCRVCAKPPPRIRVLDDSVEDWKTLPCYYCGTPDDYLEDVKRKVGFALLSPEERKEMGRRGGVKANEAPNPSWRWTRKQAKKISKAALKARRAKRRKEKQEKKDDEV